MDNFIIFERKMFLSIKDFKIWDSKSKHQNLICRDTPTFLKSQACEVLGGFFFLFKQRFSSICCKNVLRSYRNRWETSVGRHTDLSSHHHGPSISLIKAAPPTAAGGASSHGGSWTISACALCAHANRSSAQHNNRGGDTKQKHKFSLFKRWKQLTDDGPCFKTAFLTVNLPCWNSKQRHSSTHGHHPWVSGCLACLVLWLWHPLGAHAWAWAVSRPCPCGLCHGVRYGEDVVAQLSGPVQRSWGSAQSQGCLCEDQGAPSLLLAHRRTGYVCTRLKRN